MNILHIQLKYSKETGQEYRNRLTFHMGLCTDLARLVIRYFEANNSFSRRHEIFDSYFRWHLHKFMLIWLRTVKVQKIRKHVSLEIIFLTLERLSIFRSTMVFWPLYSVLMSPKKKSSFFKPVATNSCWKQNFTMQYSYIGLKQSKHIGLKGKWAKQPYLDDTRITTNFLQLMIHQKPCLETKVCSLAGYTSYQRSCLYEILQPFYDSKECKAGILNLSTLMLSWVDCFSQITHFMVCIP